ncbi:MAG: ion transporter [Hyphomicrobiales bacterium]
MKANSIQKDQNKIKDILYTIIFESNTIGGKIFDILLIVAILLSCIVVMVHSSLELQIEYESTLYAVEWFFSILFTIEYALRIYSAKNKWMYIFSFYGIIDFISTLPSYVELLYAGTQILILIRIFRVLRVFRILKLFRFINASKYLLNAIVASRHKIMVFFGFLLTIVTSMGALMYIIEGPENGFTSIPKGIYWAIVTLTTVGYGDIAPQTLLGQSLASVIMILGYAIIAVPTGIISSEITSAKLSRPSKSCSNCSKLNHDDNAKYCDHCGTSLGD